MACGRAANVPIGPGRELVLSGMEVRPIAVMVLALAGSVGVGLKPEAPECAQSIATGPPRDLAGTRWAASYFHYHEYWDFVSPDSVDVCFGQWGWSMPVDPSLIDPDSLYLGCERTAYRAVDSLLILDRRKNGAGPDTFTWRDGAFRSNWMFTYGRVVLMPWPIEDCSKHDPLEKLRADR